ncbi:S41 family peptidase [Aliiroseovarius sp. F20344]|uniref:S41 family peptidase n=1 Tax=Aliiroseovarius sp. F20344 TaxID=2926414 RepID=UPI001FF15EC7|nr:S41 family peptidase [Aliiroseovarius sp. F20344]MCK0143339.1 S41 family peptidase [Aliiroseovarius sp. F20344]
MKYFPAFFTSACLSLPLAALADDLNGVWKSKGYGLYLSLNDGGVVLDQVSAGGCVKLGSSDLEVGNDGHLHGAAKLTGMGRWAGTFDFDLSRKRDELALEIGKLNKITLSRVKALPPSCDDRPGWGALENFDVYWNYFNENYAYFEERDVDWQAMRAKYRPEVEAGVGRGRLFEILTEMTQPLNDGHVSLQAVLNAADFGELPDWIAEIGEERFEGMAREWMNKAIAGEPIKVADTIAYGRTADNLGYMAIIGMDEALLDEDAAPLAAAVDKVLGDLEETDALVIDLRMNGGGDDRVGYYIAGSFTDQVVPIGSKQVKAADGWHDLMDLQIEPTKGVHYDKPVYVLTSGFTASAAETFALALTHIENVTIVGEPSNGIFSDMFFVALPNWWMATISNERYLDAQGRNHEAKGVPLDVRAPILASDILDGKDAVMEKVRALHSAGD